MGRAEAQTPRRFFEAPLINRDPCIVMAGCRHNVLESLKCRYLKQTPEIGTLDMDLIYKICEYLAQEMRRFYKPEFSFNQFVKSKPGATRKRYLKAYKQLLNGTRRLDEIDKIAAFVKNERYYEEGKSPRMIMGRDPRFNILYARFISRLESSFFQLPQVANACDYWKCGEKFKEMLGEWMGANDMSKYESSQRQFHLWLEFLVGSMVISREEVPDFATLFGVKTKKCGGTNCGVNFDFDYCRGSGDMDTSYGNGLINYIATMYFMIINYCDRRGQCLFGQCGCLFDKFVLKGDDNYFKVPAGREDYHNTFLEFGFDAKLQINKDAKTTEFCSGYFVELSGGRYYFVQKLKKLVQGLEVVINPDTLKNGWVAHYYKSLGLMYKRLYGSLPVYSDLANFLLTASGKLGLNTHFIEESYGANEAFKNHSHNIEQVDVTDNTFLDIALVNDMSFCELNALIAYFRANKLDLPPNLSKRCNIRGSKKGDDVDVSDDVPYNFHANTARKVCRVWRKQLLKLFYSKPEQRKKILSSVAKCV